MLHIARIALCCQVVCALGRGGYGYIREFPVERLARDAKLLEIGGGTSEILRNLIVDELQRER
jgi:alkylation response protein AidB-like acyl-CoA dehydrogenase